MEWNFKKNMGPFLIFGFMLNLQNLTSNNVENYKIALVKNYF